jgi:hypothetical protein
MAGLAAPADLEFAYAKSFKGGTVAHLYRRSADVDQAMRRHRGVLGSESLIRHRRCRPMRE